MDADVRPESISVAVERLVPASRIGHEAVRHSTAGVAARTRLNYWSRSEISIRQTSTQAGQGSGTSRL